MLPFIATYLQERRQKIYLIIFYGVAAILVTLILPANLFIGGNRQNSWGNFTYPGPLYSTFAVVVFASMIIGLVLIRKALAESKHDPERLNQLKYIFVAFGLYFFCTLDFLEVYGGAGYPIGSLFFPASCAIIAYAILKHRLLDIHRAIRKTIFYSVSAISISLAYLAVVFIYYSAFMNNHKTASFLVNFLGILFIAVSFKPIEILVHRLLERRFFKGSINEISEQKAKLEKELERHERLKSVGILAAGMAHEIKNTLTAIQTFAEYLPLKYEDPEFRDRFSRIIKQEVARIKKIAGDLLLFSKPSEPEKKEFDVNKMLMDLTELLSNEVLKAHVKVMHELDAPSVFADPDQVKQALLNLILNAIDAMREKGGELHLETSSNDQEAVMRIRDNGPGIPSDKLKHIFDPFFTDKEHGTGLGLAITYSIIEKNSGKISVQSEVGKGTEFIIRLPANPGERLAKGTP